MDILDKMISDLKEGALRSEGFMRGGHVGVEVQRDNGAPVKVAVENSTLVGGLPFLGPNLAGLNAAANDGSMGSGFLTGGGAGIGQLLGGAGGAALGARAGGAVGDMAGLDKNKAALIGMLLGGAGGAVGGGMLGAAGGRALGGPGDKKVANLSGAGAVLGGLPSSFPSSLSALGPAGMAVGAGLGADPGRGLNAAIGAGGGHFLGDWAGGAAGSALGLSPGATQGLEKILGLGGAAIGGHLGGKDRRSTLDRLRGKDASALEQHYAAGSEAAKVAFLGAIGSALGGTALRAGAGRLAAGAGGKMLGGLASKALPAMSSGIGAGLTDAIGGMAGGAIGNKLQGPPKPQGMSGF